MCKSSSSFLFPLFFLIVLHCLVTVHFCLVTPFSQGTDHATLTMPPFTLLALQQSLSTPWGSELRGQGWVQALFLRGEISGRGRFGTKEESGKRLFPLLLPRGIICHAIRLRAAQYRAQAAPHLHLQEMGWGPNSSSHREQPGKLQIAQSRDQLPDSVVAQLTYSYTLWEVSSEKWQVSAKVHTGHTYIITHNAVLGITIEKFRPHFIFLMLTTTRDI